MKKCYGAIEARRKIDEAPPQSDDRPKLGKGTYGFRPGNWKPVNKGTLVGAFTLRVDPWGLLIEGCLFHRKGAREWIAFPAREWMDKDGTKHYANILTFKEKRIWDGFQAAVIPRVKELI